MNCRRGFKQCSSIGCDCFSAWAKGLISPHHKRLITEAPSMSNLTQAQKDEFSAHLHKLGRVIQACEQEIEYQSSAYDELASEVREWFNDRPETRGLLDRRCYPKLSAVVDDD